MMQPSVARNDDHVAWTGRVEDDALLRGQGRFGDDVKPEGALAAHFVRSPHAFAKIERVDIAAAKSAPGVVAVLTGADLAPAHYHSISHGHPIPGRGGKTGHIAQLMRNRGSIVAVDTSAGRLTQLREEMRRLGVTIAVAEEWDVAGGGVAHHAGRFDRILLDAPCSGLGTLRRNPDIRWSCSQKKLRPLAGMQLRLLQGAAGALKPHGVMVYAVCSPEPEETEAVVKAFLEKNRAFRVDRQPHELPETVRPLTGPMGFLQTYPHLHYMDGFFAVRLKKL